MRRQRQSKILLVVLIVVLIPLLRHSYVEYQRSKALDSLSEKTGEHACCDETDRTIAKLNGFLERDPAWTKARIMLAEEYANANDKKNEEKQYRLAVKYAPCDPQTHFELGEFLMFAKRYNEASKVFQRSVALDGGFVEARENQARCLEQSGQPNASLKVWREVLSQDPKNIPAERGVKRLARSSGT